MTETFTYSYDTLMTFSYGSAIAGAGFGAGFVGFSTATTASGFWAGAGSGALTGGLSFGIKASLQGKHFFTGKRPYLFGENYLEILNQKGITDCKSAVLAAFDKANGGTRTIEDFDLLEALFVKENPNGSLEDFFEYCGFNVEAFNNNNVDWSNIASELSKGNPSSMALRINDGGHLVSISKIRQWTPNSQIKIWYGDPEWGLESIFFKNISFYKSKYVLNNIHIFKF
ncbi:MAG: hypothetical protein LBV69_02255 [Bacteroidales bacterium]|jgi:hypothetical protein|nr:hypothetical protein [Bacteroidales bacterium]